MATTTKKEAEDDDGYYDLSHVSKFTFTLLNLITQN